MYIIFIFRRSSEKPPGLRSCAPHPNRPSTSKLEQALKIGFFGYFSYGYLSSGETSLDKRLFVVAGEETYVSEVHGGFYTSGSRIPIRDRKR